MNQITTSLGIEIPVFCGPMYPGSNPEMVAAVSEAGGLGIMQPITMTYIHKHDFRNGVQLMKSITKKPLGMNLLLIPGNKKYENRIKEWLDISIEEGIKIFLTSLGDPTWVVKLAKENGAKVYHDITTLKYANKAVDAGVDGLICVNNRAGGQTGLLSPEQIMKQLEEIKIPVVCAGGISSPESFINALEMGYSGVQMGTRFLATTECGVQESYKQAIVNASEEDIVWTNKLAGTTSSVIRSSDIEKGGLMVNPLFGYLLKNPRTKTLMRTLLLLRSMKTHKKVNQGYGNIWQAGKGVDGITKISSVAEVMQEFKEEYNKFLV